MLDDGAGSLPLLRLVIVNDNKSSTYKPGLLRTLVRLAETAPGLVSVRLIVANRPPTRSVAPFSRRFFGSDLRGNGYQALDNINKHLVVLDSRRQMEWDRVWRVRPDVVAEPVA